MYSKLMSDGWAHSQIMSPNDLIFCLDIVLTLGCNTNNLELTSDVNWGYWMRILDDKAILGQRSERDFDMNYRNLFWYIDQQILWMLTMKSWKSVLYISKHICKYHVQKALRNEGIFFFFKTFFISISCPYFSVHRILLTYKSESLHKKHLFSGHCQLALLVIKYLFSLSAIT